MRINRCRAFILAPFIFALGSLAASVDAQKARHIKVVLHSQQTESFNREAIQGNGSVVIRRGTVSPAERVIANDRQTTVQRTTGIFTLVLMVASRY